MTIHSRMTACSHISKPNETDSPFRNQRCLVLKTLIPSGILLANSFFGRFSSIVTRLQFLAIHIPASDFRLLWSLTHQIQHDFSTTLNFDKKLLDISKKEINQYAYPNCGRSFKLIPLLLIPLYNSLALLFNLDIVILKYILDINGFRGHSRSRFDREPYFHSQSASRSR